jgi:long-subunit fatty acid transport protein
MHVTKAKSTSRLTTFLYQCPLVAQRLVSFVASILLSIAVPIDTWAGGLYITEFGTPSTGVANAGAVAVGKDASTAWHNPASMTRLSGTQAMGTAGLLIPNVRFDPDSDTPVPGGDGGQPDTRHERLLCA